MKKNDVLSDVSKRENYRHELDGLRAIAVIAVIINHFDKSLLPSGYLGVDIFFVLSGFVITRSLINRETKTFRNFILSFYERRIKRLFPTMIFVGLVTGLVSVLLIYKPGFIIKTGIYSLIGFSNVHLFNQSTDYFSSSTELNTFTHTWSLGVEEQFYFVFPILFWISVFFYKKYNKLFFAHSLIFLSLISYFLFVFFNYNNQPAAYFLMPSRFWELGCGCLISFFTTLKSKSRIEFPSTLILLALICSLFLPSDYRILGTTCVVLLTCLLIIYIRPGQFSYKIFTNKYMIYLGLISYSLYLWHWPIISLSKWTTGIHFYTILWQIPLMLLLSIFTNKYIENRFRSIEWSKKSRNTISIGLVSSVLCVFLLLTSYFYRDTLLLRTFPWKNLSPIVQNLNCHLPNYEDPISQCLCNDNSQKNVIYIVGDSHAGNLVPSVKKSINKKMIVKYLTDRALINSIFGSTNCGGTQCSDNEFQSRLAFFSKNLKEGDIVMFSIARDRLYDISEYPKNRSNFLNNDKVYLLKKKLKILADVVAKKESILVLVDDIPKLTDEFEILVRKHPMNPSSIRQITSIEDRLPLTQIYLSLVNNHVKYLDPHQTLCPDKNCYSIFDGKLLYTDSSPHIAQENSIPLKSLFDEFFHSLSNEKIKLNINNKTLY